MTKGWLTAVLSLAAAAAGIAVAGMIAQQANMRTLSEFYIADLATVNMFYHERNMQEYARIGSEDIIKKFVESGGPKDCGSVEFDDREIGVWRSEGCRIEDAETMAENMSGFLTLKEASRYANKWDVSLRREVDKLCMHKNMILSFGPYEADVCFNTTLTEELRVVLDNMESEAGSEEHDCACLETFRVCWDNGEEMNFTYGIREAC